jgi:hypothetical protein
MIEAYRIGVNLNLTNGLTAPLTQIVKQLQLAGKETTALQSVLATLDKMDGKGMGAGIATLNKELQIAAGNVAKLKAEMAALSTTSSRSPAPVGALNGMYPRAVPTNSGYGFGGGAPLTGAAAGGGALNGMYPPASRYSGYGFGGGAPLTGAAAGGGGNFNYATGGRTNPMDAYGNGGSVRSVYAGGGGGGANGSNSNPYTTMFAGGILAGVGKGLLGAVLSPMDAAREYELSFTKFKTLNLGDTVNTQADQFARSANLMSVSAKDLMETMSESVGLFGGFDMAKAIAPQVAMLNVANSAIFKGKIGKIDEGSVRDLAKFIDRRGGTKDTTTFMRNLDLAQKMVTGSGGFIKLKDLANFSQYGGLAFRGLSDEGLLNMSGILQEQGGARAGTGLMSMYQNLIGGRTPIKTMYQIQGMGLGKIHDQVHAGVGGKKITSKIMGDIKEGALLQSNPTEWWRSVAIPAMVAHGVKSDAEQLKMVNLMMSNRTGSNQASIMTTQQFQVMRDASVTKNAMGYEQTISAWKADPNSKFADMMAKWNGLMIELGTATIPVLISGITRLIPVLISMANFARENKTVIKYLVFALGGLAIAGIVAGGVLLFGGALTMIGSIGLAGMGAGLVAVGGGLLHVIAAIAAFKVAYAAGSWINEKIVNPGVQAITGNKNDTLGSAIYDWTHKKEGMRPPGFDPVASKQNKTVVHTTVNLDGKPILKLVDTHMSKQANKPMAGTSRHDGNMSLQPVGATGSW